MSPGDTFHRWTVLDRNGPVRGADRLFRVRCQCGVEGAVPGYALRKGLSKSCGCLRADVQRVRKTTHGLSKSKTYWVWHAMRQRCENPRTKHYDNYGGRGITVCERWSSFDLFLEDMGEAPPGLTLDREDSNGSYCKDNCRWATRTEQANNTRSARTVAVGDQEFTIAQLAAAEGVSHHAMYCRLFQYGWPVERAAPITAKLSKENR